MHFGVHLHVVNIRSRPDPFESETLQSNQLPSFGTLGSNLMLTSPCALMWLTRWLCWCRQLAVRHWVTARFRLLQQEPGTRCFVMSGTCLPWSPSAWNSQLYCLCVLHHYLHHRKVIPYWSAAKMSETCCRQDLVWDMFWACFVSRHVCELRNVEILS